VGCTQAAVAWLKPSLETDRGTDQARRVCGSWCDALRPEILLAETWGTARSSSALACLV